MTPTGPKDSFGLRKWEPRWQVNTRGLDPDTIADLALENFRMQPGHIFNPTDTIVLAGYPVGEVEVEIPHGIWAWVVSDGEAYIPTPYETATHAYVTTDAVWYAVIDPDTLQEAIDAYVA